MSEYKILGDITRQRQGFAFSSADFSLDETNSVVLTPGNFTPDGTLYFGSKTKFFKSEIPNDYVLQNGDLVLVMTDLTSEMNILGSTVEINSEKKILLNQRIAKLDVSNPLELNKYFLKYYLNSEQARRHLKKRATGTTVRHISTKTMMTLPVLVPSLDEQQKIVEILSDCDRSIEILTSQILQKEKTLSDWRHRSFISEQKVKLGSLARLLYGKGFKSENYKEDGDCAVFGTGGQIANAGEFIGVGPNIVIPRKGSLDRVHFIPAKKKFWVIDTAYFCKTNLDMNYLWHFLQTINFTRLSEGSGVPSLPSDVFNRIKIPNHNPEKQKQIADCLDLAIEEINNKKDQLILFKKQKRGLMQQLLSGKLKVKVAA